MFSRSFPGPWKKISEFQEFSRNSRSSKHHDIVYNTHKKKVAIDLSSIVFHIRCSISEYR